MAFSWTAADLEALQDAIKQGARRVKYTDKEIEYRSLKDMLALEARMSKALGLTTSNNTRILAEYADGLEDVE